ncbi:hypothetical protein [Mumia sp. Pv 4-285]|uniref:hypothetical protein n=1 Tax=Mumia qirimensis TaxID=3234852 RepID=UPI00351CFFC5
MSAVTDVSTALSNALGADRAEQVLRRLDSYSNQPNAVKGASKLPSDPELERAALQLFDDPAAAAAASLGDLTGADPAVSSTTAWALLALAARADVTLLDRLPTEITERGAPKLAMIRRAVTKHTAALANAPASPATPVAGDALAIPEKVSQVARWLKERPDADPALFAAHQGQRANARRVAMRALGSLGSPAALRVLEGYVRDRYPDTELAELHRAWGRFDRRTFAATMFRPATRSLHLGVCSTIEGIGAVRGLAGLDVVFVDHADLAPLAECTDLERLSVHATQGSALTSVEALTRLPALTELHLIGTTSAADLNVLQTTSVERLYLHLDGADGTFLTRMPRLRSLKLSAGTDSDDSVVGDMLVDVVLELVSAGVEVVVYRHEKAWVSHLIAAAPDDITTVEQSGYIGLTRDALAADDLGRRLFSNLVP